VSRTALGLDLATGCVLDFDCKGGFVVVCLVVVVLARNAPGDGVVLLLKGSLSLLFPVLNGFLLLVDVVFLAIFSPSKLSGCLASDLRSFVSLVVAGTLVAGDLVTFLGTSVLTYNLNGFLKS